MTAFYIDVYIYLPLSKAINKRQRSVLNRSATHVSESQSVTTLQAKYGWLQLHARYIHANLERVLVDELCF